ncbi:hypothetical protein SAMN02990966_00278 [Rhodospirillales bacterium URHD0017]|nr:hypothetical protein SAMN02990966_00278 [Rhodospirillales bacterium URHD0017]
MSSFRSLTPAIGILFALLAPGRQPALADDIGGQQAAEPAAANPAAANPAAADPEAWRFRAALYGWAPSMSGSLTARGQTVDVNASFIQILQKSDSLIGFMGYFEANKGPVGLYTDLVWAKLGFDHSAASWRNPVAGLNISTRSNTAVTYSMTIIEAGGLYEVAHWPGAPGSFTALDGLLGFRYWNNSVDLNFDLDATVDFSRLSNLLGRDVSFSHGFGIARSGSLDWVDPVIGLRLRHQFTPSQEIMVRGDVGGFDLQSNFEWQALGVYSYAWQFTGYQLAALIGYRALGINHGNAGNNNSINIVLHGPIVGLSVRF